MNCFAFYLADAGGVLINWTSSGSAPQTGGELTW
jgi:hypothetical protein